ncbi:unnamed protein product, partial [Rotaria sordida]
FNFLVLKFDQLKEMKQNENNISNCLSSSEWEIELEFTINKSISSINTDTQNDEESNCSTQDVLDNSFYLFKSSSILSHCIYQINEGNT